MALPQEKRISPVSVSPSWRASILVAVVLLAPMSARGQSAYRNLDGGRPVRVEDAIVTERFGLELDLLNLRFDELSDLRTRLQWEPQISYGVFPRTEMWVRLPVFYRERTSVPRGGLAGIGAGAMYQFTIEHQILPAVALSAEVFKPGGANALPASYSARALLTRSFSSGRLHLNGSIATYAVRAGPSLVITCPGTPSPGSTCGGQSLPPLDGPCSVVTEAASFQCSARPVELGTAAGQAAAGDTETHEHWFLGIAYDKTFALSSTLIVVDLFAEKFEGIGRKTDMTAEVGFRRQIRPQAVVSGAFGRHFRGAGFSTFVTAGLTLTRPLQP